MIFSVYLVDKPPICLASWGFMLSTVLEKLGILVMVLYRYAVIAYLRSKAEKLIKFIVNFG